MVSRSEEQRDHVEEKHDVLAQSAPDNARPVMDEIREFCVICVSATLSASLYCTLQVREDHQFRLPTGWTVELKQGEQQIQRYVAGYPRNFIDLFRHLGEAAVVQVRMEQSPVGVWAKLEWFGLRVCPEHIWTAQDMWKAGGNRNWRP